MWWRPSAGWASIPPARTAERFDRRPKRPSRGWQSLPGPRANRRHEIFCPCGAPRPPGRGSAYRQSGHISAGMQEGAAVPSCAIRSGGMYAARSGCKPLPLNNPFGEAWRAEALQLPSEPGDMCGGFGSLAQQGFPARFPGRAPRRRGNVSWRKRLAAPAFFDKRTGACAPAFVIPEEGGTRPPVRFLPARPGALPEGRPVRPKAPPPTLRANRAAPWPSGRWCANPCP